MHRPQTAPGAKATRRILVVEDSPVVRLFLKRTLEKPLLHCEVEMASDGFEALEALDRTCFDLIICDLNMPNMDGRDFCRLVRARNCECLRRIVIFTSDYHCRNEPQFQNDPAFVVLQKPAGPAEIQNVILHELYWGEAPQQH